MRPNPIRAGTIRGKFVSALVTLRSRVMATFGLALLATIVAAACADSTDSEDSASAQPTAAQPAATAPTAAPTAAPTTVPTITATAPTTAPTTVPSKVPTVAASEPTATASSAERPKLPTSDLPIEEQKKALLAIANERLAGFSNKELPRLKLPPDARDSRQGGIWITMEFNGDEQDTIPESKEWVDIFMRDTYEALFTAGYDLAEVDMTALMETVIRGHVGGSGMAPAQVFKTRLKRDVAETIDWANKEALDFNELWDTLLLNVLWKRALIAAEEGD